MYYERIDTHDGYPTCGEATAIILKNKSLSRKASNFLFRVNRKLNGKEMLEVAAWCDRNLKDDYLVGKDVSGFKDEHDAMAFKLRWI